MRTTPVTVLAQQMTEAYDDLCDTTRKQLQAEYVRRGGRAQKPAKLPYEQRVRARLNQSRASK